MKLRIAILVALAVFLFLVNGTIFTQNFQRNIGFVMLSKANLDYFIDYEKLVSVYASAHKLFALNDDVERAEVNSQNLLRVAQTFDSQQKYKEALHWYFLAIQTGDNISDGWYYVAVAENWRPPDNTEDPQYALKALLRALEINQFSSDEMKSLANYRVASLYCNYMNQSPSVCIPYYEESIRLNPNNSFALMELGRQLYLQTRDISLGKEKISKAISVSNAFEQKWAYYHLGEIFRDAGEYELAAEQYERALVIDSHFEQAKNALRGLQ